MYKYKSNCQCSIVKSFNIFIIVIIKLFVVVAAGDDKKQCNNVEYLINNETVSNSTLYIPVNKSAVIGCRKCSGNEPPVWRIDHQRNRIPDCVKDDSDTIVCAETHGRIDYLKFISFTKSLVGNYKCSKTFVWIDVLLG